MSYRLRIYFEDETPVDLAEEYDTIDEAETEIESVLGSFFQNDEGEYLEAIGGEIVR